MFRSRILTGTFIHSLGGVGFFQPPSTRETYADVKLDHLPHKSGNIDVIVFVENC